MALALVNTDNVDDLESPDPTFEFQLDGAISVTTLTLNGRTFLYVAGLDDNGVSVFEVAANGTLTHVFRDAILFGASTVATVDVDGQPFLAVAARYFDPDTAQQEDGFRISAALANGAFLTSETVTDADNVNFRLEGAFGATSAVIGGNSYIFVAGPDEDGIQSYRVFETGAVQARDIIDDTENANYELDGVSALATARVGDTTFLFAAGLIDDGISVFSVDEVGVFTGNPDNVSDSEGAEEMFLDGVVSLATAVVGSKTFLFAAGRTDNGVSVFEVAANGTLTNVFNLSDNATLELAGARAVTTATIAGTTYLFVAGQTDDGISVFGVAPDGTLVNFANITDDGALELNSVSSLTTAVINGSTLLFASGQTDDGVSVFRVDTTGLTINGTGGNDTINAVSSAPGQLLPSELGDTINGLGGNDVIDALGGADKIFGGANNDTMTGGSGNDTLTGGNGRDIHNGGLNADRFDFNTIAETKVGALRDVINDFKRAQADKIDLAGIDAKTGVGGNQKFTFIGTDAFSGEKGELRFKDLGATCVVQGDVNGNGTADFEILVKVGNLGAVDFIL